MKTKRPTGPTGYQCASGNTVKYHASSGCRSLDRCGAAVGGDPDQQPFSEVLFRIV